MPDPNTGLSSLARELLSLDSRSSVSNLPIADHIESVLTGFAVERLDYTDAAGVAKRALVAHRGNGSGLALSGQMDTVPDIEWQEDPWSARLTDDGVLQGLGSIDVKGSVSAAIVAARSLPSRLPDTLLIRTDEETTKQGARLIVQSSQLVQKHKPRAVLVVEPTRLVPVRGHRANIAFTCVATGVQAHSSTGRGYNANWKPLPFLIETKAMFERLRTDASLQDPEYDPTFSDFNLVIDNHGTAINVTVPKATARIKFRYSAKIDATPVVETVRAAAARAGVEVSEAREGTPPELPVDHPVVRLCADVTDTAAMTAPYGADASELQAIAPCIVLGPGDIAEAHTPSEKMHIADLTAALPVFMPLAARVAG